MAKKKEPNFIVYSNGVDEVLVCTPETHRILLEDFFENGGRILEDYDRRDILDTICISFSTGIKVDS
jgi:hypothetical protein